MITRASSLAFLLLVVGEAAAQTVVPVRPIRANSVISESDLKVTAESIPGAVSDIASIVGREAKVTLYTGRPILRTMIGAPAVIERNEVVRMVYSNGPLTITTEGRALDRAGIGDPVRVMNLTSKQTVSGAVAADGSVKVRQ